MIVDFKNIENTRKLSELFSGLDIKSIELQNIKLSRVIS